MNKKITLPKLATLTALACALAGCAHVPAERNAPLAQRDVAATVIAEDIKLARDGWPEARWWGSYGDPQLDGLIAAALAANPNLDTAAAQIASAHSTLDRTRSAAGLEAGVYGGMNRQRYSATGLFPAPIGGSYFTEETVRVEARYNFDWWGRNKAQVAAAAGEVHAHQADYAQAERALAAAIAQSYFRLQGGWARRANLAQLATAQQAVIDDAAKRIARGLGVSDEERQASGELAQLRKQLAQLDGDNLREREALRALLGGDNAPGAGASGTAADAAPRATTAQLLAALQPRALPAGPHALPSRLGMELLARRPDLQAARWRVEASLSRIDAAKAAFYPDINISAAAGLNSISFERLLEAPSRTLFAGPTITLPLFDSKRLAAQLEGTRSERNALVAEYNRAVVAAVRDVAQDAAAVQALEAETAEQAAASASAQSLLRSAQAKLAGGLAGQRAVLNASLNALRQQDAALQLQQLSLQAEVALIHSLGGGYRADTAFTLK
ncbi:efflux transporter outer membrane subunit [Pseudoduganella aquatica]|uniref:Efflux transporter outer membrane subunit n=1 Tax=Pseudoduganella aquatica TaxID=2660641 RepID=A0A7X4KPH5_9BURK|nr:efflux transporter outer membrane subunit [Pseudoduganella aquatica]MYN09236.1 efflux transporter outer membrane subunit [Pseudoduganella aquatica]